MALFDNGIFIYFLLFTMIVSSDCLEPQCSKFPYEEALLEKMIRMEIEVEQMRNEINKVKEEVMSELTKLRENKEEMINKVNEKVNLELNKLKETRTEVKKTTEQLTQGLQIKNDQLESTVKNLVSNATVTIGGMANDLEMVQEQNEEKLMRMSDDLLILKNDTIKAAMAPNIHFVAKAVKKMRYQKDEVFIFDTIVSNDGDVYNPLTGVFSAQVGGNYIFTLQLCGDTSSWYEYGFVVNENHIQNTWDKSECWSSTVVTRLEINDRVFVKNMHSSNTLLADNDRWNMFSGVLVSK